MLDLYEELRAICLALDQAGIAYAIVGGIAVSLYTAPRATKDIDIFISPADLSALAAGLKPLGFAVLAAPMTFAGGRIAIHRFTKLARADFLSLDVLTARDPILEQQVLGARQQVSNQLQSIWLAPVEGLIELKKLRGSPQDLVDIAALGKERA